MQPQHSCSTLESRNKISVAWFKSYISLTTLFTIIPCYTRHPFLKIGISCREPEI